MLTNAGETNTTTYACAGCGCQLRARHDPLVCPECERPALDRVPAE